MIATLLSALILATSQGPDVQGSLAAWRGSHGGNWRLVIDAESGFGRLLYGGAAESATPPRTDEEFAALARLHIESTSQMHGIDPASLVFDRTVCLPLARAGSSDKLTIQFRQELGGVPVVRGFVTVLFDARGRLLSIDSTALPATFGFDPTPLLAPERATELAAARYGAEERTVARVESDAQLVVAQIVQDGTRSPVLAWEVTVLGPAAPRDRSAFLYRIDARSGAVVEREPLVHALDVSGTVVTWATPGLGPDTPGNPEATVPVPHAIVTSAAGNAETDALGNFTIQGASAPLQVTVTYAGPFCDANNAAGPDHVTVAVLTQNAGSVVTMNSSTTPQDTAQANAFVWINALRDWTRAVNPGDPTADYQLIAICNSAFTCGASYANGTVSFSTASASCANSAYSTVVLHEAGHGLNVRYGSGNGPDGFGEGNADVFAMYSADDPVIGRDFLGPGTKIRDGNNLRQFCGDASPGCHGGTHANGEVLMGALWKVRANLKSTLGNAAGAAVADALFNAWMNAFNDFQIKSIIETHWLILDDDDGNIDNGTPHHDDIDAAFRVQGFPGHTATCSSPDTYCTAKTNSLGCVPAIAWNGMPSAAATAGFVVLGANVRNNKAGILLYGVNGRAATPFQGGFLCVAPQIRRTVGAGSGGTPPPVNDCSGIYSLDFSAFSHGLLGGNPLPALTVAGTLVNAQWWGRDPGFAPPSNTTLSNGIEFVVCP